MTPINETLSDASHRAEALEDRLHGLKDLSAEFGQSLTTAFRQTALEGKRLDTVLKQLVLRLSDRILTAALEPLSRGLSQGLSNGLNRVIGGLAGSLTNPTAGAGSSSGIPIQPFARGGVIAAPAYFPAGKALGLAGEAGPEAIMPLARDGSGRLGVRAAENARPIQITFNVNAADTDAFRRSEAEITALLARAVARGQRNL